MGEHREQETSDGLRDTGDSTTARVPSEPDAEASGAGTPDPGLLTRGVLGGALMGLANLVPGISGGTMLVATGIYPRFVAAVADLTALRFRAGTLLLLAVVGFAAAGAVVLLAGPMATLVVEHRWIAYSLFIGLTLGGLPVVWRMLDRPAPSVLAGAAFGVVAMVLLASAERGGAAAGGDGASLVRLLAAGAGGASAMILPGVSGGYLLLVLGVYVPFLGAIDAARAAVSAGDLAALWPPVFEVLVPIGVGVVIGVALVSNVVRFLLRRFPRPTLGALLGLLLGAVVGLWPFQEPVPPQPGDLVDGRPISAEEIAALDPAEYPTERVHPSGGQAAGALGLAGLGIGLTTGIAWLGRALERRPRSRAPDAAP